MMVESAKQVSRRHSLLSEVMGVLFHWHVRSCFTFVLFSHKHVQPHFDPAIGGEVFDTQQH